MICRAAALGLMALAPMTAARADDSAGGAASLVEKVRVSRALYDIGMAQSDPLLVLAAATLRKGAAVQDEGLQPVGRAPADGAAWVTWLDMARDAARLAEDDPALKEKAQQLGLVAARGRRDGPARTDDYVSPGQKNVYFSVAFRGGKFAHVYVEGSGATDLDLYIYNGKGQLICSDTDASDRSYCGWIPGTNEAFSITVLNKGDAPNTYSLITN